MQIGVLLDNFKADLRESVTKAAKLGLTGIQAYAVSGELAPDNMTAVKCKEWLDRVKSNGIVFSALCGDLIHTADSRFKGFYNKEANDYLVPNSKKVMELAKNLECNVVITHIGVVPTEENEQKKYMREACHELAVFADSIGSYFAIETGPETAQVLADFLDTLGASGVRVNYDPANLVMCVADDPVQGVHTLGKYIVHTHAKDGVQLTANPVTYEELPLGKGGVEWDNYLMALHKIGFNGFLTIEREVGDNPEADIRMAADFLRERLAALGL